MRKVEPCAEVWQKIWAAGRNSFMYNEIQRWPPGYSSLVSLTSGQAGQVMHTWWSQSSITESWETQFQITQSPRSHGRDGDWTWLRCPAHHWHCINNNKTAESYAWIPCFGHFLHVAVDKVWASSSSKKNDEELQRRNSTTSWSCQRGSSATSEHVPKIQKCFLLPWSLKHALQTGRPLTAGQLVSLFEAHKFRLVQSHHVGFYSFTPIFVTSFHT